MHCSDHSSKQLIHKSYIEHLSDWFISSKVMESKRKYFRCKKTTHTLHDRSIRIRCENKPIHSYGNWVYPYPFYVPHRTRWTWKSLPRLMLMSEQSWTRLRWKTRLGRSPFVWWLTHLTRILVVWLSIWPISPMFVEAVIEPMLTYARSKVSSSSLFGWICYFSHVFRFERVENWSTIIIIDVTV